MATLDLDVNLSYLIFRIDTVFQRKFETSKKTISVVNCIHNLMVISFQQNLRINKVNKFKTTSPFVRHIYTFLLMGGTVASRLLIQFVQTRSYIPAEKLREKVGRGRGAVFTLDLYFLFIILVRPLVYNFFYHIKCTNTCILHVHVHICICTYMYFSNHY